MKKIRLVSLLVGYCFASFAQAPTKLDATQVVEQLLNTKVFIDYGNSKKAIETHSLVQRL